MLKVPLLDLEPSPVASVRLPPVVSVLSPANILTPPPDPLNPLPTASKIDPPRPPDDDPEPTYKAPLLPRLAVPELNTSKPLTPLVPAFAVRILRSPLLVLDPEPLTSVIIPPVKRLLRPDIRPSCPPDPLVPLPTVSMMEPPRPLTADPVPIRKAPLLPPLAVPELKTSKPLTPAAPAFALRILISPLLVAMLDPVIMVIEPPVYILLSPEYRPSRPPDPLDPLPTVSRIDPPRPPDEDPDPMYKAPLLPKLAVPELNINRPLTPFVPAFAERILNVPLLVL